MSDARLIAPGKPGVLARWTTSQKSGVGTAMSTASPLWFTVAHGILNELYYPTLDRANTRDAGFLIAADPDFFSEEKRHTRHDVKPIEQGVPGYRLINTCEHGRYRIEKTIITDPERPVLLMKVKFEALQGKLSDYRLYFVLSPHIGNQGGNNTACAERCNGIPMLFAEREHVTFAMGCSVDWKAMSCGYVGASDGWQQISKDRKLTTCYQEAKDGNVALTGEIDLEKTKGEFVISIGFGDSIPGAGHSARAGLLSNFAAKAKAYVEGWNAFQAQCEPLVCPQQAAFDLYRVSTAVLRTHESKEFRGAIIASLSIPWGDMRGDRDIDGYHFVWPRDQVRSALGLLAAKDVPNAQATLFHLMCTQREDGSWPKNMWVNGETYRQATQNDQTAGFLLLAEALHRHASWGEVDPWPSMRRAAEFLLRTGPVTEEDRWEENTGYAVYTLATSIAALVIAGEFAGNRKNEDFKKRCLAAADSWNESIEKWLYATDTELSRKFGVDGYYVRLSPPKTKGPEDLKKLRVSLRNYDPPEKGSFLACEVVSPDALELVRLGLRRPDDPRIVNTLKVIDATLKKETKSGVVWRRFTHDGYGEGADGKPFLKKGGIGRGWPLLTGERAHYELARGNRAEAERLMGVLVNQSQPGGLLPEQIWDADDIPEQDMYNGRPTGSAMPLAWAHAEFICLLRSLKDGRVFDCPPCVQQRYAGR